MFGVVGGNVPSIYDAVFETGLCTKRGRGEGGIKACPTALGAVPAYCRLRQQLNIHLCTYLAPADGAMGGSTDEEEKQGGDRNTARLPGT